MKDDIFNEMEELIDTKDELEDAVEEQNSGEGKKEVVKSEKKTKSDKPSEADKIEASNLLEEVSDILNPCIRCGMCKPLCPVFKVLREEPITPRGKVHLLSDKILDKIIYQCTLCKGCEQKCPLNIKVCDAIVKAREAMVLKGKGLKSNEEMMENVRKDGNPFGKGEINPDKLYCC